MGKLNPRQEAKRAAYQCRVLATVGIALGEAALKLPQGNPKRKLAREQLERILAVQQQLKEKCQFYMSLCGEIDEPETN